MWHKKTCEEFAKYIFDTCKNEDASPCVFCSKFLGKGKGCSEPFHFRNETCVQGIAEKAQKDVVVSRSLVELSDSEIQEFLEENFSATKVKQIRREIRIDTISCTMYTEWHGVNSQGEWMKTVLRDKVFLRNPLNTQDCIGGGFPITEQDKKNFLDFCVKHNVCRKE